MSAPETPAERGMAAVERAHRLYTTGRTSHTQYVASIAAGIAISKATPDGAPAGPRQVGGFAKAWPLP